MRKLLLLLILCLPAFAVEEVTIAGPMALSTGSNPITITINTTETSAGVQFNLTFPVAVQSFTATIAGSAASASKSVNCDALLLNRTTCVVVAAGNATVINNGLIVNINAIASNPTGTQVFSLSAASGVDATGTPIAYTVGADLSISSVTSTSLRELSGKSIVRGKARVN